MTKNKPRKPRPGDIVKIDGFASKVWRIVRIDGDLAEATSLYASPRMDVRGINTARISFSDGVLA